MRTDENNNPAAITVDVARQGGLAKDLDYTDGTPFPPPSTLITAKLLGDPVALTIRVIDEIGYFTQRGTPRWTYAALPKWTWNALTPDQKRDMVGYHYLHEGGTEMRGLFPNYGAP
jgi:hypothetical protein